MKYTNRKNTPLKWNNFLKFFIIPLLILKQLYSVVSIICELCFINISYLNNHMINNIISAYGYSIRNLGPFFWVVIGIVIVEILILVYLIKMEVKLIQWNRFGYRMWLVYLAVYWSIGLVNSILSFNYVDKLLSYYGYASIRNYYLAISIFIGVILTILFIANIIYYVKRRNLFREDYNEVSQIGDETNIEEITNNSEINQPLENTAELNQVVEETINNEDVVESVSNNDETKEEIEHKYCPSCGHVLGEDDLNFCSNCGSKLNEE